MSAGMRRYVSITGTGSGVAPSAGYQLYLREVLPPDEERDAPPKEPIVGDDKHDEDRYMHRLVMLMKSLKNPSSRRNKPPPPPEIPKEFKERHRKIRWVLKHGQTT